MYATEISVLRSLVALQQLLLLILLLLLLLLLSLLLLLLLRSHGSERRCPSKSFGLPWSVSGENGDREERQMRRRMT